MRFFFKEGNGEVEITRKESIDIQVSIAVAEYNVRDINRLLVVMGQSGGCSAGDSVAVDWNFAIDYLNSVEKRLDAVCELMDMGGVTSVSLEEVNHGISIIHELLGRFDKLKEKLG